MAKITELWAENYQKINCRDVISFREGRVREIYRQRKKIYIHTILEELGFTNWQRITFQVPCSLSPRRKKLWWKKLIGKEKCKIKQIEVTQKCAFLILHFSRFSSELDSYLIIYNSNFTSFFAILKCVIDCKILFVNPGIVKPYQKVDIILCIFLGNTSSCKNLKCFTKGYMYYSLGLKTVYYMSISWETSFKKNYKDFNRHE